MTNLLNRFAWVAWMLTALSIVVSLAFAQPLPGSAGIGVGGPVLDWAVTLIIVTAVAMMLAAEVRACTGDVIQMRIARWLMLCSMSVYASRLTLSLLDSGDVRISPVALTALLGIGLAQIIISADRLWICRASRHVERRKRDRRVA